MSNQCLTKIIMFCSITLWLNPLANEYAALKWALDSLWPDPPPAAACAPRPQPLHLTLQSAWPLRDGTSQLPRVVAILDDLLTKPIVGASVRIITMGNRLSQKMAGSRAIKNFQSDDITVTETGPEMQYYRRSGDCPVRDGTCHSYTVLVTAAVDCFAFYRADLPEPETQRN